MKIHFWGVRGSIPAPLTPLQIQAKISAVIQRISVKDIESNETREKFIASLPSWLYGTIGGNTPCIQIQSSDGSLILLDAGSGIRVYGKTGEKPKNKIYNIVFSHFHWDHIQGLPFFDDAYNPKAELNFYSPFPEMQDYIKNQMIAPYYPVGFDSFTKKNHFMTVNEGVDFQIGNLFISCCKMSHPGNSYTYSFIEDGKKFVYATDVELEQNDFLHTDLREHIFSNADVLILDAQYTVEEAYKKEKWGHSAFCYAIDFASSYNVKSLYLFHHEPTYSDKKIFAILNAAKWYADYVAHGNIEVHLAVEGVEITL